MIAIEQQLYKPHIMVFTKQLKYYLSKRNILAQSVYIRTPWNTLKYLYSIDSEVIEMLKFATSFQVDDG